jgi:hypothetical protein
MAIPLGLNPVAAVCYISRRSSVCFLGGERETIQSTRWEVFVAKTPSALVLLAAVDSF